MNDLESAVAKLLDSVKFKFIRIENYRCYSCGKIQNSRAKGWPDFYVYHPVHMAIECKNKGDKLRKEQREILIDIYKSGDKVIVLYDNTDELIRELRKMGKIV